MGQQKTYGLPYKGSKSQIAEQLISVLPSGKRFVDLFGGGGSMSQVAYLSGKYNSILYNDIQPNLVKFFKDTIEGKYKYEVFTPTFITRDEFFKNKDNDAYIKYIYSFNNNGGSYLFPKKIEDEQKSIHNYIVFNIKDDYIKTTYPLINLKEVGIENRRLEWIKNIKNIMVSPPPQQLLRIIDLERLNRLQHIDIKNIEFSCKDYKEYEHKDGDVVYCDVPYEGSEGYRVKFDIKEFYDWAYNQPYEIYFSSYNNIMDNRFYPIKELTPPLSSYSRNSTHRNERKEILYCNKPVKSHIYEQLSLF